MYNNKFDHFVILCLCQKRDGTVAIFMYSLEEYMNIARAPPLIWHKHKIVCIRGLVTALWHIVVYQGHSQNTRA